MIPPFITASALNVDGITHGFFGRRGGVSKGVFESLNTGQGSDDDPDHVGDNRARVARAIGADPNHLHSLHQIHSRKVVVLTEPLSDRPEADGFVTQFPGLAISALGADCAPVLFFDPKAQIIGACHAGWRGALDGVTDAVISAMENLGGERAHIRAAIGPCIHQDSYQVGAEFRDTFLSKTSSHAQFFKAGTIRDDGSNSFMFNLPGFLFAKLQDAGLSRIDPSPACTYAHARDYFSYRRNTHAGLSAYGRNISAIMLTE